MTYGLIICLDHILTYGLDHHILTYGLDHHILTYGLDHHILTYGLDHHIPTKLNENEIKTEFEAFCYGLNKHLNHLTAVEKDELKSKLRRSCENYYKIKNDNRVQDTIQKLSRIKT